MGNHQTYFNEWDPNRLSKVTGLTPQQVLALHQDFIRVTDDDNAMDKYEFRRCYEVLVPGASNTHHAADKAFKAFDRNDTGYITFEEFLSAYVMLNQSVSAHDRANFLIDQHNPNPSGVITPEYGCQVFTRMNDFYGVQSDPEQSWAQFYNGSNGGDQDRFIQHLVDHPQYKSHY
ncbi:unnamed protein product [Didymodactylos carnosus]|uniref:EF-hand domain-containing protein n=1 Tax=Didymodactylos carnosus TaxID=1234261 RepID=A0A814LIE2_9BILA|nr:unnamed protein product [Didymodactylos carnosus]CAF1066620.1 unnamed protein product [Didymodactylos carnosus]CAF3663496.1 unnamed protein product [Didymodactylos carnosus]CAF3834213.1 unnamed protein product [Didymodactylos carnosus]